MATKRKADSSAIAQVKAAAKTYERKYNLSTNGAKATQRIKNFKDANGVPSYEAKAMAAKTQNWKKTVAQSQKKKPQQPAQRKPFSPEEWRISDELRTSKKEDGENAITEEMRAMKRPSANVRANRNVAKANANASKAVRKSRIEAAAKSYPMGDMPGLMKSRTSTIKKQAKVKKTAGNGQRVPATRRTK